MKKITISAIALLLSISCFAQKQAGFPFKGGKEAMTKFFKDSVSIPQEIIKRRVTGVVMLKFTADDKGEVSKTIIYYADDAYLTIPINDALKKSAGKWVIDAKEKTHDFVMPFYIRYNLPEVDDADLAKSALTNYRRKKPIYSNNQIPLDMVTLLPAVTINYDIVL